MFFSEMVAEDFYERLYKVVRPSQPIDASEFLFGRDRQYETMKSALYAPGRHSFIYGHRGVGKSSLAHSLAFDLQEQAEPILLSCDESTTLESIVADALREAGMSGAYKSEWSVSVSLGMGGTGVKFEKKGGTGTHDIKITDTSSAVFALDYLRQIHSDKPFIIIDEFDRIQSAQEREKFGTLLKQLGDKRSPVKFIFTGIAESYEELLMGHASSARQIHELKLEPLHYSGCFAITDRAFSEFGLNVPEDLRIRIAGISDGYPHYVHLICEKMLVLAYERQLDKVNEQLFFDGLNEAVTSVAQSLRGPYEKATYARDNHYTYLLWAVADSRDMLRSIHGIRSSYQSVIEQVAWKTKTDIPPANDASLSRILRNFRGSDYGQVVIPAFDGKRRGWYTFRENILRGYIRMCAEANRIKLNFDTLSSHEPTAQARSAIRPVKSMSQIESEIEFERRLQDRK